MMASNQRFCLTGTCAGVNDYCKEEIEDELLDALLIDIGRTGVPCRSPLNAPQEESKLPRLFSTELVSQSNHNELSHAEQAGFMI